MKTNAPSATVPTFKTDFQLFFLVWGLLNLPTSVIRTRNI